MQISKEVQKILANYDSDNTETLKNLSHILMHGKLGGTGKLLILPVDQGFEHGPDKSFSKNPDAYDPHYHYQFAIDAQLSAYAAPLGMLECGAKIFEGKIPTILKLNSNNALAPKTQEPDQAITSSVDDAVRLRCSAVGFTIYPGSEKSLEMFEKAAIIIREAKVKGLPTVIWAYPRGENLTKEDETSLEAISYSAHIAALLGAHIIKVKIPDGNNIKHVVNSCFAGKRIVVFSGGYKKSDHEILSDIRTINDFGGNGSMIGRNLFQRKKQDSMSLIKAIYDIYNS